MTPTSWQGIWIASSVNAGEEKKKQVVYHPSESGKRTERITVPNLESKLEF